MKSKGKSVKQPSGKVVVITNQQGQCVAVTRQDDEGKILSVIWEAKQLPVNQELSVFDVVHNAVITAISKCKAASGHHRTIDMFVNSVQITHDSLSSYQYPQQKPLTAYRIDTIAHSMPGGLDGFMKGWGWQQFARAVEAEHEIGVKK